MSEVDVGILHRLYQVYRLLNLGLPLNDNLAQFQPLLNFNFGFYKHVSSRSKLTATFIYRYSHK